MRRASGNHAHDRHSFPVGDGGRRRCPVCKKPATRECAEHPEYLAENFLRRAENLSASGTLTPYQAHKLRKVLAASARKGGAM